MVADLIRGGVIAYRCPVCGAPNGTCTGGSHVVLPPDLLLEGGPNVMAEPKPPARYPEQEVGEGQEHSYIGEDTGEVVTTPAFQPGDTNVDETPPEVTPETTGTIRRAETDAKSRSPRENK